MAMTSRLSRQLRLETLEGRVTPAITTSAVMGGPVLEAQASRDVVFVDEYLLDQVPQQELTGRDVVTVSTSSDAISQISAALAARTNVGVVRLISHGEAGAILLGDQVIDQRVLSARSQEIAAWGTHLSPGADILIYGCSVASTEDGIAFTDQLSTLTGADVAASTGLTGANGGDTTLEYATGQITHGLGASLTAWQDAGLQLPTTILPNQRTGMGISMTAGSSQQFPNLSAFAEINRDGTVSAWGSGTAGGTVPTVLGATTATGFVRTIQLYSNEAAFAALRSDGSLIVWGDNNFGATPPSGSIANALTSGVVAVYSTQNGFAALKSDKTIVWWYGNNTNSGTQAAPSGSVTISGVFTTQRAYAALRSDGTVDLFGDANAGGSLLSGQSIPNNVQSIVSNQRAFAAIGIANDGSAWGDTAYGGGGTAAAAFKVFSNQRAFAYTLADGSVKVWGDAAYGGGTYTTSLKNVITVSSTERAFCAINASGDVEAWGDSAYGGTGAPTNIGSTGQVFSTGSAFAAFNGSAGNLSLVSVWGNAAAGGTSPGSLTGVANVYSNTGAFAVLKNVDVNGNGAVQAWGDAAFGGTGVPTDITTGNKVTQVYSTNNQFTAQLTDKSVTSWGNGSPAAPNTTSSSQVASPLVQRPWFVSESNTSFLVGTAGNFTITARAIPFATVSPYAQGDITYAIYSINGSTTSTTLPSGLSFNTSSGLINGTPAAGTGGLYKVVFTATNSIGKTYDAEFNLTINEPVGSISSANNKAYDVLSTNTFTVTTTGGYPLANSFSLTGSSIPAWVTISATSNGQASLAVNPPTGTAGTYTFTINATNGFNPAATQGFTLTINKITPTLTWTNFTSPITYGDLLSSNATTGQLNAVLGNLGAGGAVPTNANTVYKADGNTVTTANFLNANLSGYTMTATSQGTADYNSVTINPPNGAKLIVNKYTPALTWANFTSPITYGDLLSSNATTGQLNAVLTGSATSGTTQPTALVYTRPVNITLNPGDLLDAGTYAITATSAESANYNTRSETKNLTVDKATSTTALVASPNPSVYGTLVTFTATVTGRGSGVTPTGSVEFYDGTTLLSTQTLSSGVAVYTTNALIVGSHNIVAKYTGNSNYLNSDSNAVSQTVTKISTSTALTTSLNPSTYGDLVKFTATVSGVAGLLKPSGTVLFMDGSTQIGSATLTNGVAEFSIGTLLASTLSVSHDIQAQYQGDDNYLPSNSNPPLVQTVLAATPVPVVSTNQSSSTYGDQITISASVPAVGLGTVPVGSVNIFGGLSGTTLLTPIPLPLDSQGMASFNYRWLPAGTNLLTVQYVSQDPNYNNATSAVVNQTVAKADQQISWNPVVSTITYGTPLGQDQLNATVTGVSGDPSYVPTLVYDPVAGTVLGASPNAYALAVEAVANGSINPNYNPASAAVPLTVLKATPLPTVSALPNPSVYGNPIIITAQVPAVGSGAIPVGTVIFLNGTTEIGRDSLSSSGTAALNYSQLLAGDNNLSIQFVSQDTNYNDGTSPVVVQTVNKAASSTALIASPNPSVYGSIITFTATVTGVSGALLPTGTVQFVDSTTSTLVGTGTLANGVATLSISSMLAGSSYSIVASYLGDSNYTGSDSPNDPLTIAQANTTTTVTTQAPVPFGTTITISAAVTGVQGALIPSGTVTFVSGTTTLSTVTLNAQGIASFQLSTLPVGVNNIVATYNGDNNYNTSSGNASQTINKANTTTTVVSSLNPSLLGNSVTFTATVVQASGAPKPTGTVQFSYGSTILGSVALDAQGVAALPTTLMPPGINSVVATYAGDGNYNGSNGSVSQTVNWAPTITSANATTFTVGTTGNFTVTSTGYPDRTYSIAGTLPSGVTFNTSTGILSGNPAALTGGTYALVVTASNGINPDATQNFTLTVNEAPAITSANTVTFTETIAGSFTVTSTGFPARTYALSGALPSGMTFNTNTGVISGTPADGTLGTYPVTVTASNGINPAATQLLTINVWRNVPAATGGNLTTPFNLGPGSYVVSLGNGKVLINNPDGKQQQFTPFPGFNGTLSTSLVDRNGDGTADSIMVAVATGGAPAVLVLDAGTGNVAYNFYAFDPGFRGGVTVAGGVTKINGVATTVVLGGAGPGAEPSISAFDAVTGTFRKAFYAYAQAYRGGVRVAMSGPDSTGQSLVVASPAINSHVTTFTLEDPSKALASFYAFNPVTLYQGVWVAAGHLNGDGLSELVVGAGPGKNGKAEVSVFDLQGNLQKNFLAFAQGFTGGVSVAVSDYNKDGVGDIFASSGAGAKATFNVFNYADLSLIDAVFLPTDSLLGTFVANNPSAGSQPFNPNGT